MSGRAGGRYTIGKLPIGSGAQAEVWPARRDDGLFVAIKFARPARAAIEALDAEGRYLEDLARNGVVCTVPCIDRVVWEGRPGLVLPRLPRDVNALVRTRVAADPGRGFEAVLGVAGQLARALAALHGAELRRPGQPGHLVHRDVKPDNVLVDSTGAIRLADLGGSLLVDGRVTRELGVFGSPLWAPPDQMLPGIAEPNPTWDTYAACVMVYTWIAEDRPSFQAEPGPRLRPRGREILERMIEMATAGPAARGAAIDALFAAREGARVSDVIAPEAPVRLPRVDRERLATGVGRLADSVLYGDEGLQDAIDGVVAVLERGLSPHATYASGHRYWHAAELAEDLEGIARQLGKWRRYRTWPAPSLPVRIDRTVIDAAGDARRVVLPDLGTLAERSVRKPGRIVEQAAAAAGGRARKGGWAPLVALLGLFVAWPAPPDPAEGLPAKSVVVSAGTVPGGASPASAVETRLPTFRIGRTEVSNSAFASCVAAGACTPLAWTEPASPGARHKAEPFRTLGGDRQPAVGVTWDQAAAWCTWAGGRLPTELEWERATFGGPLATEWRPWPWGDAPPDCTRANLGTCGRGATVAVDAGEGASAWGAVHLIGNAWEWTGSSAPKGSGRVLRGGAFDAGATVGASAVRTKGKARSAGVAKEGGGFRRVDHPSRVSPVYSFRCVFPVDPDDQGPL